VLGIMEIALMTKLILDGIALKQGFSVDLGWMAVTTFALIAEKLISAYHTERLTKKFIPEPKEFAVRKI
jgi:hypothetical protein